MARWMAVAHRRRVLVRGWTPVVRRAPVPHRAHHQADTQLTVKRRHHLQSSIASVLARPTIGRKGGRRLSPTWGNAYSNAREHIGPRTVTHRLLRRQREAGRNGRRRVDAPSHAGTKRSGGRRYGGAARRTRVAGLAAPSVFAPSTVAGYRRQSRAATTKAARPTDHEHRRTASRRSAGSPFDPVAALPAIFMYTFSFICGRRVVDDDARDGRDRHDRARRQTRQRAPRRNPARAPRPRNSTVQRFTSTTSRPRTRPSSRSPAAAIASPSAISRVIASTRSRSRSCASRAQAA